MISADNFRPYFKDEGYNGSNAAAVQEPASYLAKRALTEALKNKGRFALNLGGGSGTGKTSAIKLIPEAQTVKSQSAVVFDSNFSTLKTAQAKVREERVAGVLPQNFFIYRDPIESFVDGVVTRMKNNPDEMGRLVPVKVVADNHVNSWKVAQDVYKNGVDGKKVDYYFIDNTFGKDKAKLVSFDQLANKIKLPTVEELTNKLREVVKTLDLTPEQLKGYLE